MKKIIYIIAILFFAIGLHAQNSVDEILASNDINTGKSEHIILTSAFQQMEAESLDGIYKLFADNGNLSEVRSFDNGQMDGTWLQYDEQQNLVAVANYKEGKKHGSWIIWDANAIKRYEMHYVAGERSGDWKSWDQSGVLISTRTY